MNKFHEVEPRGLDGRILKLVVDGRDYEINLDQESNALKNATETQLLDFKISPSGYGIHWPRIDEDLAIDPLIGIEHETPVWKVAEDAPDYKTKKDEL